MKKEILSLSGEALQDPRKKFDEALKIALRRMLETRIQEGTVTLALDVQIEEGYENGQTVLYPAFSYKIKTKIGARAEIKGSIMEQMKISELLDDETGEVDTYIAGANISMEDLKQGCA